MPSTRPPVRVATLLAPWLLTGCVVVPQSRAVYDSACGVATRQITLEVAMLPGIHQCQGDACVTLMVSAGVVTVASAVISGSVAVVGNVLYWAERQAGCLRPAGVPLPAPPTPSAPPAPKT